MIRLLKNCRIFFNFVRKKYGNQSEYQKDKKNELPANVKLIAVSKTKGIDEIMEAYNAGQRHFGENKVQEMIAKQPHLPSDIHWHFIGHLQTNKVKFIAPPFVNMIESVDRLKVLKEINKHAAALNRVIPCLLQFHIAEEESKFGLTLSESYEILDNNYFDKLKKRKYLWRNGNGNPY